MGKKGAITFIGYWGVYQEDKMEGSLWRATSGRALGHMMRWNQSARHATIMVAGKRLPASMLSRAQRRDENSSPTTEALARSLSESKVQSVIESTWLFQERGTGQQVGHHRLRMEVITEAGALFGYDP